MDEANDRLEWTVDVGGDRPERRITVVAIALGAAFVGVKMGGLLLGVVGLFVVLSSTAELFLRVRYRLDGSGAESRCGLSVTSIGWPQVRRLIPMADGVRLSPLERAGRLDAFRGVYLKFCSNEEEVSGTIRQFWHGDTGALDRGPDGSGDGGTVDEPVDADPTSKA